MKTITIEGNVVDQVETSILEEILRRLDYNCIIYLFFWIINHYYYYH